MDQRSPPDGLSEDAARDAVWREWEARHPPRPSTWRRWFRKQEAWREELAPGETGDVDGYVAPPKRAVFPPSFLALVAAGIAFLALEPAVDLSYTLLGPTTVTDLGEPGGFHLDAARDGAAASIRGFAYPDRGTFSRNFHDYEVLALTGVPVLVRRSPQPRPPPDTAELYSGRGRLLRIAADDSSFLERLFDPASRYTTVRQQFQSIGELPVGQPCWLLLDGELPRTHLFPILLPFVLWAAAIAFAHSAWRSLRLRRVR